MPDLKKIVLKNTLLTSIFMFYYKMKLKKKLNVSCEKGAFVGPSTICEGHNFFAKNSSIYNSSIGYASYLAENTKISKTEIGRFSSIGPNVKCIFGKHPTHTFVSTHPAFFSTRKVTGLAYAKDQLFKEFEDPIDQNNRYSIRIGNDVWIGSGVNIMDGVTIGDGAVVAANALVTKDVAPYDIVGGVPAKVIKQRFSEKQRTALLKLKWWAKSIAWIEQNANTFTNLDEFLEIHNDD